MRAVETDMTPVLAECLATFRRWQDLPDAGHLLVAVAAVLANRGPGDPVWILVVGGPSSGKTETIMALAGEPDIHLAALMTEAGLLSGTPKREHAKDASGGLLRDIGAFGIILAKDFGSILSMNRDTRAALMAALREVFDGAWVRHVGTDGGRTLTWAGKVGLVGGVTSAIDTHHAVMASLGERFLLYRLPDPMEEDQGRQALAGVGDEREMRAAMSAAVGAVLAQADTALLSRKPTDADATRRLVGLAALTARCRSAVERDGYSREIELVMAREGPARLVKTLLQMFNALRAIGLGDGATWALVTKLALDCIPPTRLAAVRDLMAGGDTSTADLAARVGLPTQTTRRALEDLAAHGVAQRTKHGQRDLWAATPWLTDHWPTIPERLVEDVRLSSPSHSSNFSGTSAASLAAPSNGHVGDLLGLEAVERLQLVRAFNEGHGS
jgi:hypothetical protein